MPSLYCNHLSTNDSSISLEGEEFHHLAHVKRIGIGQRVILNNGKGLVAEAIIKELTKKSALLEIVSKQQSIYPETNFAIAFALLKNKHDELLIEKCTELGAKTFIPLMTDFSVRNPSANTVSRFQRIALAAIKQCDNPWLPDIKTPQELDKALDIMIEIGYKPVLCSEKMPEARLLDLPQLQKPCFIVGPEGGFSEAEFSLFARRDVVQISICNLIIRAETAAMAIAAQFAGLT